MNNEWCVYVNPKLLISILLNLLRCLLAQMDVRRMCTLLLRGMFQTCPWRKSTDGLHVELYPPWLPDCLSISYQKRAVQVSEVNLRLPVSPRHPAGLCSPRLFDALWFGRQGRLFQGRDCRSYGEVSLTRPLLRPSYQQIPLLVAGHLCGTVGREESACRAELFPPAVSAPCPP